MQGSSPGVRAGHASVNIGTKASHGTKIDLKIRLVFLRNIIPYSVVCAIDAHLFLLEGFDSSTLLYQLLAFKKRFNVLFMVCSFMSLGVLGTNITTMMFGCLM